MYLNPHSNKAHADEEETVIEQQVHGWVYESHCWSVIHRHRPHYKVCKWCGRESSVDMVMDKPGGHTMCDGNPIIKVLFGELASQIEAGKPVGVEDGN